MLERYRNRPVNEPEADAVVELVAELCANPEYDGMDISVISLLGSTQSELIADKLWTGSARSPESAACAAVKQRTSGRRA